MSTYTADEMMAVEAARRVGDGTVCFVGIGLPSLAANLARRTHAPDCVLVYESGTIGAKPEELPLSIGDGELAETADAVVPVPEMFAYWLQGGRIDVGFLGAAQIDRHGNLNSTVIGDYDRPKVRLPGGGGAPEIALDVEDVFVMLRQSPRSFVDHLDFTTSVGDRVRVVVTDLGVHRAAGRQAELAHAGSPGSYARAGAGGDGLAAADLRRGARDRAAGPGELTALRSLRTKARPRDRSIRGPGCPSRRRGARPGGPGRLSRLPLDALARAGPAARHAARGVPLARRAGVRRRDRLAPRQRPHAPARRRAARRADHRSRPRARRGPPADPRRARRGLAGERRRALQARGRSASRAARPELLGRRPLPHRRRRPLPLRHRQARLLSLGKPRERLAARAHPLSRCSGVPSPSGS